MKRSYYLFFFSFVLFGCRNHAYEVEAPKVVLNSSDLLRIRFAQVVHGTPLEVPILEKSDPSIFIMPVSDDKNNIKIDRFYLVKYTEPNNGFSFEDDIYLINRIEIINESDDTIKYVAVVNSIRDNQLHRFEIDWFEYQKMWRWKCPYTIKLPIVTLQDQSHQFER